MTRSKHTAECHTVRLEVKVKHPHNGGRRQARMRNRKPCCLARASLALPGSSFDANHDDGLIVECVLCSGMLADCGENCVDDSIGRGIAILRDNLFEPSTSEKIAGTIASVENAIAEENEQLAGFGLECELVVFGIIEKPERQAGSFDEFCFAPAAINRARQAGVRYTQAAVLVVPDGIDERDKLAVNAAFSQRKVHGREHLCRCRLDRCMGPEDPADQSCID